MIPAEPTPRLRFERFERLLDRIPHVEFRGRVTGLVGVLARASLPDAWVGEQCLIRNPAGGAELQAEVVGFRGNEALIMPLGSAHRIGMGSEVIPSGRSLSVGVGTDLLGRVLDGLGKPLDIEQNGPIDTDIEYPVLRSVSNPLERRIIDRRLDTGIKAIDALLTCGVGQRIGLFAAAGVGKSTLLGALARNVDADVIVVALIGERGREVSEFLEQNLGETRSKSVVIVATSDEPPLVRLKSAYVAATVAEYFRDQGKRVLLLMDSVTRFARAQRDVGLAIGEPPARAGFTPSVFNELPRLLERAGNWDRGSITGFYTVLVEGDDENEPVADEVRSILDGHIFLSRELFSQGIRPAIDVSRSVSRLMNAVTEDVHQEYARRVSDFVGAYYKNKEAIELGYYRDGSNPRIDLAKSRRQQLQTLLTQGRMEEKVPFDSTLELLRRAAEG